MDQTKISLVNPIRASYIEETHDPRITLFDLPTKTFRDNARLWLRSVLIKLIQKLGIGSHQLRRTQDHPCLNYITIEHQKVGESVMDQLETLRRAHLEPGFIMMGHEAFRSVISERDPRVMFPGAPMHVPPIQLRYRNQTNISHFTVRDTSMPLAGIAQHVCKELEHATYVEGGHDHLRQSITFTGEFLHALPILVLPWLEGAVVVPLAEPNRRGARLY